MLCTPVFIFTSNSSALLGHQYCGSSRWLLLPSIFNTLFWVYANTWRLPFSYMKMPTDGSSSNINSNSSSSSSNNSNSNSNSKIATATATAFSTSTSNRNNYSTSTSTSNNNTLEPRSPKSVAHLIKLHIFIMGWNVTHDMQLLMAHRE